MKTQSKSRIVVLVLLIFLVLLSLPLAISFVGISFILTQKDRFGGWVRGRSKLELMLIGVLALTIIGKVVIYRKITSDQVPHVEKRRWASLMLMDGGGLVESVARRDALAVIRFQDPFTATEFQYASDVPYSVGPDLTDDRLGVTYDPSNGILSRGDIPLPIRGGLVPTSHTPESEVPSRQRRLADDDPAG